VLTTGTAGGVGSEVELGDVIVARHVRWDATRTFASAPFAQQTYTSPAVVDPALDALKTAAATLIPVNASRLPAADRPPQILVDTDETPLTTLRGPAA
jgi:uridine phosphorylase